MITIDGHLEHITFHNAENHYTIAKFRLRDTESLVTVVGYLPDPNPGESLRIKGTWKTHSRYGEQLNIESYEIVLPKTTESITTYLASGMIEGIGPKMAERIVSHFCDDSLDIIENNPEKLLQVPGIGKNKVARISASWKAHHALRHLMHFLQDNSIPVPLSAKILRAYGNDAMTVLEENPYQAAKDIPGIQFSMADALARRLGMSEDDPKRIHACIHHIMEQHASDGHMYAIHDRLIQRCKRLLNVGQDEIGAGIDALIDSGELVRCAVSNEDEALGIFLQAYHQIETGIANRLTALLSIPVTLPEIDTTLIIAEVLKKLAIKLSPEQLDVLGGIFAHRVAIITGGPGTGKTTLIRSITAILSLLGKQTLLAAPTGRAARRLSEVTQRRTSTIHKLLGFNFVEGDFDKNQDDPLEADTVIIDEASMVDAPLMFHLLKAIPMSAELILVGDVFQLPSVGPGNVLSDLIQSHKIQTYELKTIYRQAQESSIVMNAHKVRMGEPLDLDGPDHSEFYFIKQHNPEKAVETIVKLCSESIPRKYDLDRIGEIQVLSPMHKGAVGTINLNQVLQKALNSEPSPDGKPHGIFRIGDKVMHLKNNYQKDVFNGDIGIIRTIENSEHMLSVDYEGWIVEYDFEELDELSLAYAISVHKSQGSEYPAVIIPLMTQHYPLLQRNLLYTAMTRGKRLVIFVGTEQALDIALKNDKPRKRLSSLAYRLSEQGASAE